VDYPDCILKRLDIVVAAVPSDFGLPRGQQTERILGALDNLRYGVDQARRGWLKAKDIVNSRKIAKLRALIRAPRQL